MKKYLIIVGFFVLASSFLLVANPSKVSALSGSEFQAGRIMDDGVFFNPSSMSTTDIQNFLNSKLPTCDTNGTQPYAGTTRAAYGTSRGYPPPYTCLKDYSMTTVSKTAEAGLCNGYGVANQSSAQIIQGVAQSCGVSPKILLVLLQKEQSLVTDDWPWSIQYRSATGYGCPDTAPCDAQYYGFFNQVYAAARQYKNYAKNPSYYNYKAGQSNYIRYNPNAACGGANIYIQNQATAGLYNYTPYQPNASALNNLYGTGDSCGAYGNRNFWRMYNDWFGSTFSASWDWQVVSQRAYNNVEKTWVADTNNMWPGKQYRMVVVARNTGNQTWQKGVVNVGTSKPFDRRSSFCDSSWLNNVGCNRTVTLKENSVAPGQNGTFEFWVKTPMQGGISTEYFNLVADGHSWMKDQGMYWDFRVQSPSYSWQRVSQASYTDSTKSTAASTTLNGGQRIFLVLKAKNTSNNSWSKTNYPTRLGTFSQPDRRSAVCDSTWLGLNCNRVVALKETIVNPGETGTFEFWVKAPVVTTQTTFNEHFNIAMDGRTWLNDIGLYWSITVRPSIYSWSPVSQQSFVNQTKATPVNTSNLATNSRYYLVLKAKNTGNQTWNKNTVNLGTSNPNDRSSTVCDTTTWLNVACNRATTLVENQVTPGQTGTFEFWIKTPALAGIKNEYFSVVADGLTWMNNPGMYWTIKFN